MNTLSKILAILAIGATAGAAQAQLYGEIGYTPLNVTAHSGANSLKASPSVLGATIGYDVHQYFAVEAMAAFNVRDDQVELNGAAVPAQLKIDNSYGLYLKPKMMLNDKFEVFGRLGYLKTKMTASGTGLSQSDSYKGAAYGLGANYYFNPKTYATVSYTNFYDKDDGKVDGVTFGVGMKF